MTTQVRLLRVLENGEFMKVGSSKVLKTNVRVITATNINIPNAITQGKFREDLYYRLNTINIFIPPLRERKEDISFLFKKFASDFADKYHTPSIRLSEEALNIIKDYNWAWKYSTIKKFLAPNYQLSKKKEIFQRQLY